MKDLEIFKRDFVKGIPPFKTPLILLILHFTACKEVLVNNNILCIVLCSIITCRIYPCRSCLEIKTNDSRLLFSSYSTQHTEPWFNIFLVFFFLSIWSCFITFILQFSSPFSHFFSANQIVWYRQRLDKEVRRSSWSNNSVWLFRRSYCSS